MASLTSLFSKLKGLGGSLKNKLGSMVSKGSLAPNRVTGPTVPTVSGPTVVDTVDDFLPTNGIWKRVNDNVDEFIPYYYGMDTTGKVWQQFDDNPSEIFIDGKSFHKPYPFNTGSPQGFSNDLTKERLLNKRMRPIGNLSKSTAIGDRLSTLYDELYSSGPNAVEGMVPDDIIGTPYSDRFGNTVTMVNDSEVDDVFGIRTLPNMEKIPLTQQLARDSYARANTHSWAMHFDPETGREFPVPIDRSFDSVGPNQIPDPIPVDAYTAPPPFEPAFEFNGEPTVSKDMFRSYQPDLEYSGIYPDGFTDPEDYARYYDALERGYTLKGDLIDPVKKRYSDDVNSMVLAHNLLKQQELGMPQSQQTYEQARQLVSRYFEPNHGALRNHSIPNRQYVRQKSLDGTLYNLYDRLLNNELPSEDIDSISAWPSRRRSKSSNLSPEQAFNNAMFWDDLWFK